MHPEFTAYSCREWCLLHLQTLSTSGDDQEKKRTPKTYREPVNLSLLLCHESKTAFEFFCVAQNLSENHMVSGSQTTDLAGLLSSVTTITSGTLASLGSLAVGLSPSILENADGNVLKENLQSLSTVTGWSVTQASVIVSKVVQSNFQVNVNTLINLGELIIGLPSAELNKLQLLDIVNLATNAKFSSYMEQAPVVLKQKFVLMVIQASSISDKTIFQLVPATLASEIPASHLLVSNLNLSVINQMKWTSSQVTNIQKRALSLMS
ncbi:uncharacterized protein LOC143925738 [Lithobates pipiens]